MEDLITLIPEEEKELLTDYVNMYMHSTYDTSAPNARTPIEYRLRFWNNNKQDLFKLLGGHIIISNKVHYTKSDDELEKMIDEMFGEDDKVDTCNYLVNSFFKIRNDYFGDWSLSNDPSNVNHKMIWYMLSDLTDYGPLVRNSIDNEKYRDVNYFIFDRGPHYNGKPLKIDKSMKLMRIMSKLVDWFELDKEEFEKFRIWHSQVLNTSEIDGNVCLSIHPLDYLTMSDNACNWESCMNWYSVGDYRMGTVEMMNSAVVLEAYVNADHPYYPLCNDPARPSSTEKRTWSNKKWRCLYIVNKDIITTIKEYPYHNSDINNFVLKWIKELAEKNMNWSYFPNVYSVASGKKINLPNNTATFQMATKFMYNDYYNEHLAYVSDNLIYGSINMINYSGETECMDCGEELDDEESFDGSSAVICYSCYGLAKCYDCGGYFDVDEMYWHDNEHYCDYCAQDHFTTCTICDNTYWAEDDFEKFGNVFDVVIYNKEKTCAKTLRYDCQVCDNCFDDYDLGDLADKVHRDVHTEGIWGVSNIVDVDEMTEKEKYLFVRDKEIEQKRKEFNPIPEPILKVPNYVFAVPFAK